MRARHVLVVCIALLVLTARSLRGADYYWDRGAGTDLWADATNWLPNGSPDFQDVLLLTNASLAGPQAIDLAGSRSISNIYALSVSGAYIFSNSVPGGALNIFGPAGGSNLLSESPTGALTFDTDVRYRVADRMLINSDVDGGKIVFNAGRTLSSSADSGTTIFNFTSRNTVLDYAIEVHSAIADGPTARVAVESGFVGDADAHIGRVLMDGLNTYTGSTSISGMTLTINSIADYGPAAAASALARSDDAVRRHHLARRQRCSAKQHPGYTPLFGHHS